MVSVIIVIKILMPRMFFCTLINYFTICKYYALKLYNVSEAHLDQPCEHQPIIFWIGWTCNTYNVSINTFYIKNVPVVLEKLAKKFQLS
jgi:hypothetical protein